MLRFPFDKPNPFDASAVGNRGTNASRTAATNASAAPTHNALMSNVRSRARTENREA
jgi:hypothetical protein